LPFLVVSAGSHGAKVQVLPATSLALVERLISRSRNDALGDWPILQTDVPLLQST